MKEGSIILDAQVVNDPEQGIFQINWVTDSLGHENVTFNLKEPDLKKLEATIPTLVGARVEALGLPIGVNSVITIKFRRLDGDLVTWTIRDFVGDLYEG